MAAPFPSFDSRTVAIDGVNIHYVCGGSGSPLVLVHGLGSSAALEIYFNLQPLAAKQTVLALDLSDLRPPDNPVPQYTMALSVNALRDCKAIEEARSACR